MNKIFIFLILSSHLTNGLKRLINSGQKTVDENSPSINYNEVNALDVCACDITKNSCDTYCCCDTDCNDNVLNSWKNNYELYCAKNKFSQAKKGRVETCIDSASLFTTNLYSGLK